MLDAERFPFTERYDEFGVPNNVPYLPLTLTYQNSSLDVLGLLDTGASVNVLPYEVGLQLGAVWEQQTVSLLLAGNLDPAEARGLVVSAKIGRFAPVNLVFAWTESNEVPLLLGQLNFFLEFDACFYRSQLAFEVRPRQT